MRSRTVKTKKLFFTGLKTYNFPSASRKTKRPVAVDFQEFDAKDIKNIACGLSHCIFLLKNGKCYVAGKNGSHQLGYVESEIKTLRQLSFPKNEKIMAVSTNETHSVFLTKDGVVYLTGSFGKDSPLNSVNLKEFSVDFAVTDVVSGFQRFYLITENGDAFGVGSNTKGVLGAGGSAFVARPVQLDLDGVTIKKMVCGKEHTVVLGSDGKVYGIGSDEFGQIGLSKKRVYGKATTVSSLSDKNIVDVTCGSFHTVYVSGNHNVFVTGKNNHGQLGLGHTRDIPAPAQLFPYRFARNTTIVGSVCGYFHTFFRSTTRVFACGKNSNGQLGVGSFLKPYQPCEMLCSTDVDRLFCCDENTFILRTVKVKKKKASRGGSKTIGGTSKIAPVSTAGSSTAGKKRAVSRGKKKGSREGTPLRARMGKTMGAGMMRRSMGDIKRRKRKPVASTSSSVIKLDEAHLRIKKLENEMQVIMSKCSRLEAENEVLKSKLQRSSVSVDDEFQVRVNKIRQKLEWKIDLFSKNRNFQKCLEFQTVVLKLEKITLNAESEQLISTLEQAQWFIE